MKHRYKIEIKMEFAVFESVMPHILLNLGDVREEHSVFADGVDGWLFYHDY